MAGRLTVFVTALVALDLSVGALGFSLSDKPLSFLISENADKISSLKEAAAAIASDAPEDDVFYLRYALTGADEEEMKSRLEENVRWRSSGEGRLVCDAAKVAIEKATSGDDWNNDPVRAAAPYASVVNDFITEASIVTTSSRAGDLIYCIRAASIDDTALMNAISVENLAIFFLYTKEVNAAVANQRSIGSDRLVCVCTANDLSGVKVIGGSAEFRKALSAASQKANELYPTLSGPSLLLNLPRLLTALVKIFTPLFPEEVRKKIKFARGPLSDVTALNEILAGSGGDGSKRDNFLTAVEELIYSD
mmetsp:Transcript_28389/g.66646  ORF Transcript_28389/g.66646 Transcript_28389/m.66646 type:complete len:307 (-) Transcript_28389:112-1032(-)|eukprot:CAMPEP_0185801970 /NCGR_PEP_ID=MMETSP1322-20130828/1735_1 /TAXON_ID=265543 /ORGANISM="Minutocellus polymorphus, Strain RCC2270" /LENGTH=306 /DNA_ID=CAMNT_0028497701 /DNA_START=107 /DNA_END=1027 /DNA_ORIENTATION=-